MKTKPKKTFIKGPFQCKGKNEKIQNHKKIKKK